MKRDTLSLEDIKLIHQNGDYAEAKAAYLQYLESHPHHVEALHLLGLLCAESGSLDEALTYLRGALSVALHDITIKLHLANILKAKGEYDEAIDLLQSVIAEDPMCAPAFNNMGAVYFVKQQYSQAVQAFQSAIDIRPDYIDAYYNLGLACGRCSREDEAMQAYVALLELMPTHPGARFQLACIYMKRNRLEDAMSELHAIIQIYPHHFESYANLANCYLRLGRLSEATDYYRQALDITPEDKETLFNLGVIAARQGCTHEAIEYYLRAIKVSPDYLDAHNNLAAAYLMRRDHTNALLHFQEALRLQPDNEALRHTVRILKQDKTLKTSAPAYIQALFDSYADYYDAHLKQHLHYQVPDRLFAMVQDKIALQQNQLTILDLGCGTGLCGELFRSYAASLTGVDLSENMLAIAADKNIYDELVTEDVSTYLSGKHDIYDLILAGDVLVYFGELEDLIRQVASALKSGGYFAFNVEPSDEEDYMLTASGRFAHKKSYIDKLAQQCGMRSVCCEQIALRRQAGEAVSGYLCLWQK